MKQNIYKVYEIGFHYARIKIKAYTPWQAKKIWAEQKGIPQNPGWAKNIKAERDDI